MVDIIPRVTAGRYMGISNVVTATAGAIATTISGFVIGSTAGPGADISFGPRLAIVMTVAWYAIGAWALRRVDTRPFDVQMSRPADLTAGPVSA